ncbi:S-acyl fatty acid synthase thioesterase, medium chain [Sorex fumeus]|uniref:S-acyl fatty acid synthase thioesterase, medium chain n=1 Tax=Sorex fumeus TaxID=62283 RepID=UPI0024ADC238|nr:S-acyl fatty acid synthase thioesterase, medium chain [Sorex fumeus]
MEENSKAGPVSARSVPLVEIRLNFLSRNEKVLNCLYQNPDAMFKLICFPWAGGSSTHFAKWGQMCPSLLEVHSIRLAGRENRHTEPFASDMHQVADEIVCALLPILQDKPFAFFGHSMGSYIAFLTAVCLKEKHKLEPIHLFVSSSTPPHSKARRRLQETENELSEDQMVGLLKLFGGTNVNVFDDKEFLKSYGPKLMADARLVSNYVYDAPSKAVLCCDLTCFAGSEDITQDLEAWKDITSGKVDICVRPGNHFYLLEPRNEAFVQKYITKCLEVSILAYP